MRIIETKAYQYSELSEEAKEKAKEWYRSEGLNYEWIFPEVNGTFKKFCEVFDIEWQEIDYENNNFEIRLTQLDEVKALTGIRLMTYLYNNYFRDLFKGKYYSLWSKKDVTFNYYKEGYPVLKKRYSKVMFEHSCVLTGICYDDDVLQPIYDFLEKPKNNVDFETLINDCLYSLCSSVQNEIEYRNSDECCEEEIEANEYEFDEEGNRI